MNITLKRPLVFFDLEATGISTSTDRIVEMCLIKVYPDGKEDVLNKRINPMLPYMLGRNAL